MEIITPQMFKTGILSIRLVDVMKRKHLGKTKFFTRTMKNIVARINVQKNMIIIERNTFFLSFDFEAWNKIDIIRGFNKRDDIQTFRQTILIKNLLGRNRSLIKSTDLTNFPDKIFHALEEGRPEKLKQSVVIYDHNCALVRPRVSLRVPERELRIRKEDREKSGIYFVKED